MHPRVLRELVAAVSKPLSVRFKKSWQSSEVPGDWRKGNNAPILEVVERRTLGTTDLSLSPLYPERSWNRSS